MISVNNLSLGKKGIASSYQPAFAYA